MFISNPKRAGTGFHITRGIESQTAAEFPWAAAHQDADIKFCTIWWLRNAQYAHLRKSLNKVSFRKDICVEINGKNFFIMVYMQGRNPREALSMVLLIGRFWLHNNFPKNMFSLYFWGLNFQFPAIVSYSITSCAAFRPFCIFALQGY